MNKRRPENLPNIPTRANTFNSSAISKFNNASVNSKIAKMLNNSD